MSLPEFANREGLEPQRLRRWRQRLAREARPASPARQAAPALVEFRPSPRPRQPEPIEVVLLSGITLRVAETIDPISLARLLTALRGC